MPYRRAIIIQFLAIGSVAALFALIVATTAQNLSARGIPFGLGFLFDRAGFTVAESLLAYVPEDSNAWAIVVGIGNTLYVSAITIFIATFLGLGLGIARLSSNPLVSLLARVWIETARNTPLMLLLLFLYTIWWSLPVGTVYEFLPGTHLSMRGIVIPSITIDWNRRLVSLLAAAAIVLVLMRPIVNRVGPRTGRLVRHGALTLVLAALGGGLLMLALGSLVRLNWPVVDAGEVTGGMTLTPETATILTGLVYYTTGFIAEIVRSGIQSIVRGQWEAARALGLPQRRILRFIIIPQMMRVIVPPMTSQYINVIKNSTLAIAVGYSDFLVVMGTMINKTSHAIEGTIIIIVGYLAINLSLSLVLNAYNRRVAIKER